MMMNRRIATIASTVLVLASVGASNLSAQGATTGAVTGFVTGPNGQPLENAQVQVVNRSTGFTAGQITRTGGRYYVQNLEVGRNYTVTARLIGYSPRTVDNIVVTLGQATPVNITLETQAAQLSAVTIAASATRGADFSPTHQGVTNVISDTLVQRLPNLDRDFTSLVRTTPQVTQQSGGFSAAGANPRLGQITVDGANQSDRFGLNSSNGLPGNATGGRLVPIDAIKEVQVSLTPTDVRQGNFAGVLVNAVTKSGTNDFTGGATFTYRNPSLARDTQFVRLGNLRQKQYGFYVGGPIIKDRLHFFTALERQERDQPNGGPSFLATGAATDTVAGGGGVTRAQIDRVRSISQGFGFDAGGAEVISLQTPLTNFIGRLDFRMNDQTRFVLRQLINDADQTDFSRNGSAYNPDPNVQGSGIRLTSNRIPRVNKNYSTVFQAFTNLSNGISNEFSAAYNKISDVRNPPIATPEISVSARGLNNANSQITFGTEQFSPVNVLRQNIYEFTDNVTVPYDRHTLTFGARVGYSTIFNDFRQRSFGAYKFASIDSLANKLPIGYSVAYANGPGIAADFAAEMFSLYAQDQWSASPRVTVTAGVRADVPRLPDAPVDNPNISAGFAAKGLSVSTAGNPKTRVLFSPRLGVNWDVRGNQSFQIRGNVGMYTGEPPYILIGNAYQNTGRGLAFLNCTGTQTPAFTTDVTKLPTACAGGTAPVQGAAGTAGVNLNDPDFKYPQRLVGSAGVDYLLPGGVVFTTEALYGKDINGLRIRDLNILGPRTVGGQPYMTTTGRVLYADTITSGGSSLTIVNNGQKAIITNGTNNVTFGEGAIQLTNQSKAYNYAVTPRLQKRFSRSLDMSAAYTYTRSFEVQAFTSDRAISNWRNGREHSGLENADDLTTSSYELRHRAQLYGSFTAPWKKFATDLSVVYTGNTGQPITYTVNGDLNGDGFNGNDPIYIPQNATNVSEIRIVALRNPSATFNATTNPYEPNAAAAQRFENFIKANSCLDEHRGQVMERNTCRNPWQNQFDVSVRQTLPEYRGNRLTAQLDIFNFANLLNSKWGVNQGTVLSSFTQQAALIARNRQAGPISNESLIGYEFDSRLTDANNNPKMFQDFVNSLGNVYRMQLTFKYAF
jgi:outer membrane receptor protein involved in Fe transport